jgi:hypothetical protein
LDLVHPVLAANAAGQRQITRRSTRQPRQYHQRIARVNVARNIRRDIRGEIIGPKQFEIDQRRALELVKQILHARTHLLAVGDERVASPPGRRRLFQEK